MPDKKELASRLERFERRLRAVESAHGQHGTKEGGDATQGEPSRRSCRMPRVTDRELGPGVSDRRARLIRRSSKKWVNGTELHYWFFPGAEASQVQAVHDAFAEWKDLGIGLEFTPVQRADEAELRIAFEDDGSWSYVGRDAIDHAPSPDEATINFGWDLTTAYGRDTALHEIGHALGFPHEHQNPLSGIVWDEPATIQYFARSDGWDAQDTRHNVIDKAPAWDVTGTDWDPDSIMHYDFPAGLILEPERYQRQSLNPAPGLSAADEAQVRAFYPPLEPREQELRAYEVRVLDIGPGEQVNLRLRPAWTGWYDLRTFGQSDTVLVLFEDTGGGLRYVDGDDDSGYDRNATLRARLVAGHEYVLRVRLYWASATGRAAVMYW